MFSKLFSATHDEMRRRWLYGTLFVLNKSLITKEITEITIKENRKKFRVVKRNWTGQEVNEQHNNQYRPIRNEENDAGDEQ